MDRKRYFAYDSAGNGFTFHETADEAKAEAAKALGYEQDDAASDGWGEDVESICWGTVTERVVETGRSPCDTGQFDELVDYDLRPIAPTPTEPER